MNKQRSEIRLKPRDRLRWEQEHPKSYRLLWLTSVDVADTEQPLPYPIFIASGETDNLNYYSDGSLRPGNHYAVFHYALAGTGIFRTGTEEHRVSAGTGVLFEANDPQTAFWYPPDATEPWRFVWISFAGTLALPLVREFRKQFGPLFNVPMRHPVIKRLLDRAHLSFSTLKLPPADAMQWVMQLLLTLSESASAGAVEEPGADLVRRATHWVNLNVGSPMLVEQIATQLDVSREHLSRAFLREMGIGPQEYILQQKLRLACHMLKETNLEAKQIGQRLGFGSAPAFSRAFRRVVGITPAAFRTRASPAPYP